VDGGCFSAVIGWLGAHLHSQALAETDILYQYHVGGYHWDNGWAQASSGFVLPGECLYIAWARYDSVVHL